MRSGSSDGQFPASINTENYGGETLKSRTSKQISGAFPAGHPSLFRPIPALGVGQRCEGILSRLTTPISGRVWVCHQQRGAMPTPSNDDTLSLHKAKPFTAPEAVAWKQTVPVLTAGQVIRLVYSLKALNSECRCLVMAAAMRWLCAHLEASGRGLERLTVAESEIRVAHPSVHDCCFLSGGAAECLCFHTWIECAHGAASRCPACSSEGRRRTRQKRAV